MTRDRHIEWMRLHRFVPASQFCYTTDGTDILGVGVGTAKLKELSTLSVSGPELDAAGEEGNAIIMLPFEMDPTFPMRFRVHYTGVSTTAADTYTWKGWYNNAKSAAAIAAPVTAMSPDFGATNVLSGTAYRIGRTGWADIVANKWTRAEIEAGHLLSLAFELDASDADLASGEPVYLVGFEYSFVPKLTIGLGTLRDYGNVQGSNGAA